MNFTYETQGAITYLVCELESAEQVDTLTLGMLTNNHIPGLAPVLYTEMNGQRFLKYNISAKISADQFFVGTMNKQRALTAFQNILSAICSADEYMIDPNCFSVASGHIFLNVSSCETALLCIPVISDKDINHEVADFFKKVMFSTQFDNSEDATYITQLITYINSGDSFTVYGLKDLVSKLQSGVPTGIAASPAQHVPAMQPSVNIPPVQQPMAANPPVSFDSTITMDEMSAMISQKQAPQVQMPVPNPQVQMPMQSPQVHIPSTPPVRPAQPPIPPMQPPVKPQPMPPVGAKPVNDIPPIQNNKNSQGMAKPPIPAAPPKPPAQNGPAFAIPGQSVGGNKPQTPPAPPKKQQTAESAGEKKMTFFGLLSHYNKENAELYKKQKEEAKAKKPVDAPKPTQKPAQPPIGGAASNGASGQQAPVQRPPMGVPAQQPFTPPQYQPPVQPVPVQNSFNETTVLSPAMMGGETTVLNVNPMMPDPCLTRVKTGEKISINKPVFRIGKEKSYVDYFIADNTAISRSHANIHTENGEYFIEDTNSTNHTYINGKLINSNIKTKLANGDKVKLANEDFVFSV